MQTPRRTIRASNNNVRCTVPPTEATRNTVRCTSHCTTTATRNTVRRTTLYKATRNPVTLYSLKSIAKKASNHAPLPSSDVKHDNSHEELHSLLVAVMLLQSTQPWINRQIRGRRPKQSQSLGEIYRITAFIKGL